MIIINILGGLGNQMFQYAFGYAISKKKNEVLKLDINSFETYTLREYELKLFNIETLLASKEEVEKIKFKNENIIEKLFRVIRKKVKKTSKQYYKEPHFNFDNNVYNTQSDTYLEGYWQSEEYFKEFRRELLEIFTLKNTLHAQSLEYEQKIVSTKSVSLHIRRGDYVTNLQTNSIHGTCSMEYYKNSVVQINKIIEKPQFFVFSDDLDWVKENFNFIDEMILVELNNEIPDHEEMHLMSKCKHNIIANSSFSWWGAWLNQNPNKIVIAPSQWFNDSKIDSRDLIPQSWIRL